MNSLSSPTMISIDTYESEDYIDEITPLIRSFKDRGLQCIFLREEKYLSLDEAKKIATLPSREVLIGQVVGAIAAPLTGFVGVLHERIRSFVGVLSAIAEKKKEQEK